MRFDPALRPGLAFMTLHFPDEVDTNVLTIDAVRSRSRAPRSSRPRPIRIEKLDTDDACDR